MKTLEGIALSNVQDVYNGPEGVLWELVMGEQIHIGGFKSSMDLADKAAIAPGMSGIDFCCCNGAGMRFLVKFKNVEKMIGVDATSTVVAQGISRCAKEGLSDKIQFVLADVCNSGLPDASADFVWGEDAWCYVVNKPKLISEAVRLTKPGGTIAFTDWVEGATPMTDAETHRFLTFMKFPNILNIAEYSDLLKKNSCTMLKAEDTAMMQMLAGEMIFIQKLAHEGKIAQGLFVARKAE